MARLALIDKSCSSCQCIANIVGGVAKLIHKLIDRIFESVNCFNRTFDCSIRLYNLVAGHIKHLKGPDHN